MHSPAVLLLEAPAGCLQRTQCGVACFHLLAVQKRSSNPWSLQRGVRHAVQTVIAAGSAWPAIKSVIQRCLVHELETQRAFCAPSRTADCFQLAVSAHVTKAAVVGVWAWVTEGMQQASSRYQGPCCCWVQLCWLLHRWQGCCESERASEVCLWSCAARPHHQLDSMCCWPAQLVQCAVPMISIEASGNDMPAQRL